MDANHWDLAEAKCTGERGTRFLNRYFKLENEKDDFSCPSPAGSGGRVLYRFEMETPMKKQSGGNLVTYYAIGCCYGHR